MHCLFTAIYSRAVFLIMEATGQVAQLVEHRTEKAAFTLQKQWFFQPQSGFYTRDKKRSKPLNNPFSLTSRV